jgi:pre-mRNA-processing factor 19
MKERDEAREALTSLQKTMGFAAAPAAEAQEETGDVEMEASGALPAEVEAKIMETNQA